jgi:hypothetical protein
MNELRSEIGQVVYVLARKPLTPTLRRVYAATLRRLLRDPDIVLLARLLPAPRDPVPIPYEVEFGLPNAADCDWCPECSSLRYVDSGGVTPWGDSIALPCPSCNQQIQNAA